MITEITMDGEFLWSSDSMANDLIIPQELKVEYNKAGSFRFLMLPTHPLYNEIKRMKSTIDIVIDDEEVFRGRVVDYSNDFFRQRTVVCEGDLAYLLDTVYLAKKDKVVPKNYLSRLISNHNSQLANEESGGVVSPKRFQIGTVSVSGDLNNTATEEDFDNQSARTTSDVIDDLLIGQYGGFLRTRRDPNGGPTILDYIDDSGWDNDDENGDIAFGVNLLTIEYEPPIEEVFTAVVPIGYNKYKLPETFVKNDSAVQKYGFIAKAVSFDDIKRGQEAKLRKEATTYLNKYTKAYPDTLTIKAVDLYHIGQSTRPIRLGDKVLVNSDPHSIDYDASSASKTVRCLAIEYDLTNPANTTYVLGTYIPPDKKRKSSNVGRSGGGGIGRGGGGIGSIGGFGGFSLDVEDQINKAQDKVKGGIEGFFSGVKERANEAWVNLANKFGIDPNAGGLSGTLRDFINGGVDTLSQGVQNGVSYLTDSITGDATMTSKIANTNIIGEQLETVKTVLVEAHEENAAHIVTIEGDVVKIKADITTINTKVLEINSREIKIYGKTISIDAEKIDITGAIENLVTNMLNANISLISTGSFNRVNTNYLYLNDGLRVYSSGGTAHSLCVDANNRKVTIKTNSGSTTFYVYSSETGNVTIDTT